MGMSQMMGGGGAPPDPSAKSKDHLQQKTDELRLTAFNNMAAVYSKMGKWEDCKEKCTRVLKHDEKNMKALFRRGMAFRKLNLYELARADLIKAKEVLGNKEDKAIQRELKLLDKDEKNADKAFYAKMKKQMQRAQKKKKQKQAAKDEEKKKVHDAAAKEDSNPNLKANANANADGDDKFLWDLPAEEEQSGQGLNDKEQLKSTEEPSQF